MGIKDIQSEIKKDTKEEVTIVAVTKNRSLNEVNELINSGATNIGESKWQEAKEKIGKITGVTKHFIGRLQTNKVKDVVGNFDMIQSVDSLKLARKINEECRKIKKVMPILIQVNTSNEEQKGGVKPEDTIALIKKIADMDNIKIEGVMTIGLNSNNEERIRSCFRLLKELFDKCNAQKIPMKYLSMGMSSDYKLAIEEGANMIRVGKILFTDS